MAKIKLKANELKKIKTELALLGYMAKKKLAEYLDVPQSNVSMWIKGGFVPEKHKAKLNEFIKKKGAVGEG